MRLSRLAFALPIVVVAAAFTGIGCSDPVPLIPRGAWSLTFQSPSSDCDVIGHNANAGTVEAKGKLELKADGSDGAEVACEVQASGGGYSVQGTVRSGGTYFDIDIGELKKAATFEEPSTGRIEFQTGTTVEIYRSDECIVYFVEKQLVDKGKVWASFQCASVTSGNSECAVQQGYFAFENCIGTSTGEDGEEEEE